MLVWLEEHDSDIYRKNMQLLQNILFCRMHMKWLMKPVLSSQFDDGN
jgi:hypothetical protein